MRKLIYIGTLTAALLLGACTDATSNLTPQEIIDQAVQETTTLTAYYGEYVMDLGDGQSTVIKEWVNGSQRRMELQGGDNEHLISVNDGKVLRILDVNENIVQEYNFSEEDTNPFITQSPKEQATMMLRLVEDTHEISVVGQEKIAGRNTYHIIAQAQEEGLFGDLEIWVDKENWMVLKSISNSADIKVVTEFTHFDVSPKFEADQFVLKIPEGAVIEQQEMNLTFEQVELEVVKEQLGAFLVFNEDDLTLESIQDYGSEAHVEYALNYSKNGEKWLTLSVFPTVETDEGDSLGEEKITIRNIEGEKLELGEFRLISWVENNLSYSVIIDHPDIEFEEIYELIEKMVLVQ